MKMRAKLTLTNINLLNEAEELTFNAVAADSYPEDGSDENNTFAKFTPSAVLNMTVVNPALLGTFEAGDTFYVDFTKVDEIAPEADAEATAEAQD